MIKVGEKYHMLTVKKVLPKGRAIFTCDCGNEKNIRFYNVLRDKHPTKSCGCFRKLKTAEMNKATKGMPTKPHGHSALTVMVKRYKTGARSRNLCFELTRKDLKNIIEKPCEYCGTSDSIIIDNGCYSYKCNGIDRVDSSKGYTLENCVPCCTFCNRAKYIHSKDYFINMCKKVAESNNDL